MDEREKCEQICEQIKDTMTRITADEELQSLIESVEAYKFEITDEAFKPRKYTGGYLLKTLNENTPGKTGGMCVVFGAPTGTGKTTFTAMEVNKSLEKGKKVVVWTTEADPQDYCRIIAKCNGISEESIPDKEFQDKLKSQLFIIKQPCVTESNVRCLAKYMSIFGYTELYIDYLDTSLIQTPDESAYSVSRATNKLSRACTDSASQYGLFIWIDAQAKSVEDTELTVNTFRDSTTICNAATAAFILTKVREADDPVENATHVIHFLKSRYNSQYAGPGTKIYININQETLGIQELLVTSDGQTIKQYHYKNFI